MTPNQGSAADVLQVEVQCDRLGWEKVTPPRLRGDSGVEHRFSYVARSGGTTYAFEVLGKVDERDVLGALIKGRDTRSKVIIVSSAGESSERAESLGLEHGVPIVDGNGVRGFFDSIVVVLESRAVGGP